MENVTIKETYAREIRKEEFTININLNFYGDSFNTTL